VNIVAMLNKVAVVGVGAVGQACALALMLRGSAREIVLIDRTAERATGVATDMRTAYREIVPRIVSEAPAAMLITVTDPPDPLADLTRALAGHDRVLSTGTTIDTLRFRAHVAAELGVHPSAVEGQVVGEHGTTEVMLWSSVRVAGTPLAEAL
jgi:L-lactate dehydrogenase